MTATDFCLWGYLKSKVYENSLKTITNLSNNIISEINAKYQETANVMQNFEINNLCNIAEGNEKTSKRCYFQKIKC